MGIDFKCVCMEEVHGQILTKAIVTYRCKRKNRDIKSCSGCKVKVVRHD